MLLYFRDCLENLMQTANALGGGRYTILPPDGPFDTCAWRLSVVKTFQLLSKGYALSVANTGNYISVAYRAVTPKKPYIKHVTTLGDSQRIVAIEDIRNDQGVSLVKRGTLINSSLYERLVRHKLLRPIDHVVSVEDPVTPLSLVIEAKRLLSKETDLQQAVDSRFIQRDLLTPLGSIRLEPQLAFKLTVCREQSYERYQHMLRVALIALHIASRSRWSADDAQQLATAAIFHDLGEMHLEPSLFDGNPLTLEQRRQIFAHPTIAYLFLKEFPAYHPQVSLAVYQHHERVDGSGYPAGVSGDGVVPAARVIGASELFVVTQLSEGRSARRLFSTADVLAFNAEKFDSEIILFLIEAAKCIKKDTDTWLNSSSANKKVLFERLQFVAKILQGAEGLGAGCQNDMTAFINKQLEHILEMANRCGANLHAAADLLELIDDDIALLELDSLVQEMIFLVQNTAREAMRRWAEDELPGHQQEALSEWLRNAEMALYKAGYLI